MKTVFDGLISRLDMVAKRVSALEDLSIETYEVEKPKRTKTE